MRNNILFNSIHFYYLLKFRYEMLRIEFEQTLAANEQTGPINREMRHLITSLQNQSLQLKGENNRVKKKLKETFAEVVRLRQICEDYGIKVAIGGYVVPDSKVTNDPKDESVKEVKVEEDYEDFVSGNGGQLVIVTQTETDEKTCDSKKEIKVCNELKIFVLNVKQIYFRLKKILSQLERKQIDHLHWGLLEILRAQILTLEVLVVLLL